MQRTYENLLNKIIAIILIIVLTLADILVIGLNFVSLAIEMVATSSDNVEFEAYFKNQNNEKVTIQEFNLNAEKMYMYVDINVLEEGYFNGQISLEDSNFSIVGVTTNSYVNTVEGNTIKLNQIPQGNMVTLEIQVKPNVESNMNVNVLDKNTTVKLEGKYAKSTSTNNIVEETVTGSTSVNAKFVSPSDAKGALNAEIISNNVYEVNGENKRILQVLVKSKLENNVYPVKKSEIELSLPKDIEEIEVYARSTKATNKNIVFSKENNTTFDSVNSKLKVTLENPEVDGKINFDKNATDEFVVTAIYNATKTFKNMTELETQIQNTPNAEISEEDRREAQILVSQNILTYDNKHDEEPIKSNISVNIENEKDGIINYELTQKENEFYKGKIYTGEERDYLINVRSNVNTTKVGKTISFSLDKTNYIVSENKKISKITYKEMTIKKADFTNILGDEGFITIKDENNTVIANLTKELIDSLQSTGNIRIDSNENIIITIPENTYKLDVLTSNPISIGKIDFRITKSIVENESTQEEIKTFTGIENSITIANEKQTKQITLKETTTKATLQVPNSLNEGKNENVEIKVTLLTDDESKDLYKEPTVKIVFPRNVTEIDSRYRMLGGNGLSRNDAVLKEEDGRKVLEINLSGEQVKYPEAAIIGTDIVVNATITMDETMTTGKDSFKVAYTNKKAVKYEDDGIITKEINAIQSKKFIVTNDVKEFNIQTIGKEEDKTVDLKSEEQSKTATVEISAINNEGQNLQNVKILGKFPTRNTENTMDVSLTTGIQLTSTAQNVEIYYSKMENPTDDITKTENGWSKNVNLAEANSYLIVIPSLVQGEKFTAKYGISINQNEIDSKVATQSFKVIYGKENSQSDEVVESTKVGFRGLDLIEVQMRIWGFMNNGTIKSGLDYNPYIRIKNNTNETLENIKVELITNEFWEFDKKRSEGLQDDNTVTIDKIEPDETKVISLIAKCLDRNTKGDYATIYAKVNVNGQTYTTEEIKENIENYSGKVTVEAKSSRNSEEKKVQAGDKIDYTIKIENTGTDDMNELLIRDIFPDYININKITLDGKSIDYNIEDSTHDKKSISIETKLEAGKTLTIKIETKVKDMNNSEDLEIDNAVYVFNGYKFSAIEVANVFYKDKVVDNSNDGNNTGNNTTTQPETNTTPNNETTEVEQNATPSNTATGNTEESDNTKETSYKITGSVWLDSESKGSKEINNKKISDVKVRLVNATNGKIATDKKGTEITAQTDRNGEYTLTNIEAGKYIVVFDYDTNKYKPTQYQKEGVGESNNSDAIVKEIQINGAKTSVTATDILEIKADMNNIDLGLIEVKKFDLELTKTVSKITVSNDSETKEYSFNEATLSKVEIEAKKLKKSKVSIEYTIKIKNAGEIAGYAKNIVDYLPAEIEFDQDLNKDWYKQDEYIYNKSLANEEIKPGETKEIKLILTKTMTDENTGLISNIAEIAEAENTLGISDVDSTPLNRKNGEDDIGKADVIIGVKTGTIVKYILFTMAMLALSGGSIYLINKKVLNEK